MEQKKDKQLDKVPVSFMAEFLSSPTTLVDSDGKHHSFRKFLWMGNWGFTDGDGIDVIVPAKPGYLQVDILFYSQVLVAGCYTTGWDVFSFTGKKIATFPPMSLNNLTSLVDNNDFPE